MVGIAQDWADSGKYGENRVIKDHQLPNYSSHNLQSAPKLVIPPTSAEIPVPYSPSVTGHIL